MIKAITKIFGSQHDRVMKNLSPMVQEINHREPLFQKLSNEELKNQSNIFKEKLSQGASLDDILIDAFCVTRETAWRLMGMRHYDVQLIGGRVLHDGSIAEMRTGEGKTLVATLPTYLNALSGKGVHVITVNDYLAERDADWMGQIYRYLGLSVGKILPNLNDKERKAAYGCDITYGTNNEFGFDYLRDNMKFDSENFVQRKLNYAIIDECDSILIDEARTPLIISGPSEDDVSKYAEVNKVIPHLKEGPHFTIEEKSKTVSLTEEGNAQVEKLLKVDNVYDIKNISILHYIYQGLKAHHLYKKDADYMVQDDEIVIVDEFTGRLMSGRRWSDGLHQAVEAKEGVKVKSENQTLATITFQNYFRMYDKLSGMTGTAETEAVEFKKIYDLGVVVIPTNKPIARLDQNDVIYKNQAAKYNAMTQEIKEKTQKGQPVLVGTVTIERSEYLSNLLTKSGVKHSVLNAKQHDREAEIVAQAGSKGSVTIATNMAGRGTDIVLGGNPEFIAGEPDQYETKEAYEAAVEKHKKSCEANKQAVLEAGGLCIIGTERHEARRVDNQLRGRAGRQGDPGESRFYLSLEDDLMRIFNGERMKKIMETLRIPDDEPIEAKMVSNAIEGAQKKVEGHNFDVRKHLLDYDDVMNSQRGVIYSLRRKVLLEDDLERVILDYFGDVTSQILDEFADEKMKSSEWDLEGLNIALRKQFGIDLAKDSLLNGDINDIVTSSIKKAYAHQKEVNGDVYDKLKRYILLESIDTHWKDHLKVIDHLKEGINYRAYAQKDPLVEYKKEAFEAFTSMTHSISEDVVEKLMKVRIVREGDIDDLGEKRPQKMSLEHEEAGSFAEQNIIAQHQQRQRATQNVINNQQNAAEQKTMNRAERRRQKKNR